MLIEIWTTEENIVLHIYNIHTIHKIYKSLLQDATVVCLLASLSVLPPERPATEVNYDFTKFISV